MLECHIQAPYAECLFAECCYAECLYAEGLGGFKDHLQISPILH
jgi:hypothetical protein